jgi:hypothetical protein
VNWNDVFQQRENAENIYFDYGGKKDFDVLFVVIEVVGN